VESVEAAVYTEFSRFWPSLTGSIREPLLNEEGLGNTQKWPICRYLSPLPDSNRGPPPYHGGFAPLLCDLGKRLVARFPCNSAGLSACSTLSSKDPEPPRVAANLSPEPSPKEARTCSRRGQRASVARDSAQASVVRSGWRRIADAKLALRADRSEESLR
jgi:hypothetical protein